MSPWITDASIDGNNPVPTSLMADGLHPGIAGSDAIAKAAWTQMASFFAGGASLLPGLGGKYNATYNPNGSLLATSGQELMGAGTAAVGGGEAGWSGTRCGGIWLSRKPGATGTGTISASVPTRSDGRPGKMQRLQLAVTGAAAGETYRLTWTAMAPATRCPWAV